MRIAICVDCGEQTRSVVSTALGMSHPDDQIFIVHALDIYGIDEMVYARVGDRVLERAADFMRLQAERFLKSLTEEAAIQNKRTIQTVVLANSLVQPQVQLVNFLKIHAIDAVAVGTRQLSGVKGFVLGSYSDFILADAPCDVLVVRAPKP